MRYPTPIYLSSVIVFKMDVIYMESACFEIIRRFESGDKRVKQERGKDYAKYFFYPAHPEINTVEFTISWGYLVNIFIHYANGVTILVQTLDNSPK